MPRPSGNNADEWHLFLTEHLDAQATSPNGLPFMAVQIAEAIDDAVADARAPLIRELEKFSGAEPYSHEQSEKGEN